MSITLEHVAYRLLPQVRPGRALADSEWTTLCRMSETLLEDAALTLSPERVADNVEHFLIRGQSQRAWRVRVLLTLVELMPLARFGRRFGELTRQDRRALVEQHFMLGGGLWSICAKVRLFVLMGAYGDAAVADTTGFVPMQERERFATRRAPVLRRSLSVIPPALEAAQ